VAVRRKLGAEIGGYALGVRGGFLFGRAGAHGDDASDVLSHGHKNAQQRQHQTQQGKSRPTFDMIDHPIEVHAEEAG
jgi:hypothetical protein